PLLAAQGLAGPGAAPAILVQQLLQGPVEVVDVVHGGVDVLVPQHLAADRKPAFSEVFSAVAAHGCGSPGEGGCEETAHSTRRGPARRSALWFRAHRFRAGCLRSPPSGRTLRRARSPRPKST